MEGFPLEYLEQLDLLSFVDLAKMVTKVRGRRIVEEAKAMNVAFGGDKNDWTEFRKVYLDKDDLNAGAKGIDDFMRMVGGGGIK